MIPIYHRGAPEKFAIVSVSQELFGKNMKKQFCANKTEAERKCRLE